MVSLGFVLAKDAADGVSTDAKVPAKRPDGPALGKEGHQLVLQILSGGNDEGRHRVFLTVPGFVGSGHKGF